MLFCDAHIHVGEYTDGQYFDPGIVTQELLSLGVSAWVATSTTICGGVSRFEDAIAELEMMQSAAPGCIIPALWLTPEMLASPANYLKFGFQALKIHERAHVWNPDELLVAFKLAEDVDLPLIVHTGGNDRCDAGSYRSLCTSFPNVKVVLAHGRPIDQAVNILENSSNVYVDTAFMPVEDILLVGRKFPERVLWGSDYPLDTVFFPGESRVDRYRCRATEAKTLFSDQTWEQITSGNFRDLYKRDAARE